MTAALAACAISGSMLVAGASTGYAAGGVGTLPAPGAVGSVNRILMTTQQEIDQEFWQIIQASGASTDEVCLAATNAGVASHLFHSTVSDQTLECGVPATAANLGPAEISYLLVNEVTDSLQRHAHLNCGVWSGDLLVACVDFWQKWADEILPGAGAWFRATLLDLPWTFQNGTWAPPPVPPIIVPPLPPAPPTNEVQKVTDRILKVDPSLDPTDAATTAQKCVDEEAAAGESSQPCLSEPIFVPGADAGWAALHDAGVIAQQPNWFRLTYMSGPEKQQSGVPKGWYDRAAYRIQCPDGRDKRGANCDEYPFYTTVEGGPTAFAATPLVLQEVPQPQNKAEGDALLAMQIDPACNMAVPGKPRTFPGSGSQQYLVVPFASPIGAGTFAGPPSFHVCGSPATSGGGGVPT